MYEYMRRSMTLSENSNIFRLFEAIVIINVFFSSSYWLHSHSRQLLRLQTKYGENFG